MEECGVKCNKCREKESCPYHYGQSLGLTNEQIGKFRDLVLQYREKLQASLLKSVFGSEAVMVKRAADELIDQSYLGKHFNQPNLFMLWQAAEICQEQNEKYDLAKAYYEAFLARMKPQNRAKYEILLSKNDKKARTVCALIIARSKQLEEAFNGRCLFESNRQCQTCWLYKVCKIQSITAN